MLLQNKNDQERASIDKTACMWVLTRIKGGGIVIVFITMQ